MYSVNLRKLPTVHHNHNQIIESIVLIEVKQKQHRMSKKSQRERLSIKKTFQLGNAVNPMIHLYYLNFSQTTMQKNVTKKIGNNDKKT